MAVSHVGWDITAQRLVRSAVCRELWLSTQRSGNNKATAGRRGIRDRAGTQEQGCTFMNCWKAALQPCSMRSCSSMKIQIALQSTCTGAKCWVDD